MQAAQEYAVARTGGVVTVGPDDTVAAAAQQMRDNSVGSLLVVDVAGKLVGIITERDIVNQSTALCADPGGMSVAEIMTAAPVSCSVGTPTSRANQIMVSEGIRHLPIVEGDRPVGMISSRDILAYQLQLNKAMRVVAERVASMGKTLKSLDLDEVLGVVAWEVASIFRAPHWVLHFVDDQAGQEAVPTARGYHCPCCEKGLASRPEAAAELADAEVVSPDVPGMCRQLGCQGARVVIQLGPSEAPDDAARPPSGRRSFLCMCGLPPTTAASEELLQYQAALVKDILSVYLGNAELYRKVRRTSLVDALTGVGTRRALEEKLQVEYQRAVRYGRTFSLAMIDVDSFKAVNDHSGHVAGDQVLRQLAQILRANTRPSDITARYGGDEFVVLMPETALRQATIAGERLRRTVHEEFSTREGPPVTISCGIAEWQANAQDTPEELLRRTDAALYQAKHAGRNCVATTA